MNAVEHWRPVAGYAGKYEVSNMGRVRNASGHELYYTEHNGYLSVILYKHSKQKHFKVHRLVASSFIENPDSKATVNHKNGIKWDNRVDNLEWATYSENHLHAFRLGLRRPSEKQRAAASITGRRTCALNRQKRPVYMVDDDGSRNRFDTVHDGARYVGGSASAIVRCCKGSMIHHRGKRWEYADKQ